MCSNKSKKTVLKTIFHYGIDDKSFLRDYSYLEVFLDGEKIQEYRDYYHDKGCEKVQGMLELLAYLKGKTNVIYVRINLADDNEVYEEDY